MTCPQRSLVRLLSPPEVWPAAALRYLLDGGAGTEWGYDDWLTVNTVLLKLYVEVL